jgi:Cys-rich protein (TIGR01571 family)
MLAGMLLLGFAGFIVIMPSESPESTGTGDLQRRLQMGFGYITTSRAPSSFDSSDFSSSGSSFEPSKSLESGSFESSEWNQVWPQIASSMGSTMGSLTCSLLVQAAFAILYFRVMIEPIKDDMGDLSAKNLAGGSDFSNGICECYKDKWVCAQTLLCPMVRIAHTNAVSGVCPFWESLWCWCCCAWLTVNIGPVCLLVWWRLRLKNIMRLEENAMTDFCATMFCPLLSVAQMSSAADNALGYQVTGCCEYTPYSYGGPMEYGP